VLAATLAICVCIVPREVVAITSTFSGDVELPPVAKNRITGARSVTQIEGVVADPPAGIESECESFLLPT
jgi:hypothetical protein